LPQANPAAVAPALLHRVPMMLRLRGLGFAVSIIAVTACGGKGSHNPDANQGMDASAGDDASAPDAAPSFGVTAIFPAAASRLTDTALTISGFGIVGTPRIHLVNCDQAATTYDPSTGTVISTSIATSLGVDPTRVQGAYTVVVTNGDGMVASLTCALHILAEPPPRVTQVVPSTAWQGVAADNINSDVTVNIQCIGFLSTPSVRWVSRVNPAVYFDAVFVGFVSDTHITVVVPAETQTMPVGTYDVFVTNPDQLSTRWKIGAAPGDFTITGTAPPKIADVSPARIQNGSCTSTSIAIDGTNFTAGATAWYLAPTGTLCTGSIIDASGNLLCPITVDAVAAAKVTGHFATCPALGPYPVVVINPDNQSSYWFSVEVTPSSDGHLNVGAFENQTNGLETARWKHAVQYGFDVFSDALMYVAGGQGTSNNVLGSVEASQFDLFGVPGPFHHVQQYGGVNAPRISNDLTVPREGSTLVRVGSSLFSIGGTTSRSDTTTVVAASNVVERAEILGFAQMPVMKQPAPQAQTQGLPMGSWYYRVSAIGPWGESLATREVVAIGRSGQIKVCWQAPTAAGTTKYNIYRSLAPDGRSGTTAAIAYDVSAADNCWLDTGVGSAAPGPGNARGTLAAGGTFPAGTYSYRVAAVIPLPGGGTRETYAGYSSKTTIAAADVAAGNTAINIAWDAVAIPGATYRVYRLDPATNTFQLLAGADALAATSFTDTNVAFAAGAASPVTEIRPLPPGSLSKWTTTPPHLNVAREGLDGVVVRLDPVASGGLVGRIIVAGGRDGAGGTYAYRTTAESLGIHADGTTDAAWTDETPVFAHARGYYALLTTQDRNETPFPPPPPETPCSDCGGGDGGGVILRTLSAALAPATTNSVTRTASVAAAEPVYLVAVLGDDAFQVTGNTGRNDFESCPVDLITGHLVANCGVAGGTTWVVQTSNDPQGTYGHDAILYFSYLYPFYGVQKETVGATVTTIQVLGSAIARFPLVGDLMTVAAGQVLQSFQSASTSFIVQCAYYQMARLLAYVYVIGGYAEAHLENGVTVPAGPTALVERHQQ
jgi:hypothetical protein